MKRSNSKRLYGLASKVLVGGVNSPVRAFKAVTGTPVFIRKAKGSRIYDRDNNSYIDYVMSWGAMILGHANKKVIDSLKMVLGQGTSFGAPTEKETELARLIKKAVPSIEMLRLVNSGTEATMSAIRLARGFTGREKIIKFEGCYHGHSDSLLVKAGSGAMTFSVPDSLGITKDSSKDTIVLPYNDIRALSKTVKKKYKEIACVIVEPVAANMGVVLPSVDFLSQLRSLTERYGIVLIFDEVITGFRFTFGGVQKLFGIKPDLTCLGKIIGGGLPLAAYGGRKEIMQKLAPLGNVYQAGTLSGNPVAVTCGIATLKELAGKDYVGLNSMASSLCQQMQDIMSVNKKDYVINRAGSIFTLFFTGSKVSDYKSAVASDKKKYARFFWSMLDQGIYLPPSQFEGNFLSFEHAEKDMTLTLESFAKAIKKI